tara:strand:+ start:93 stop:608 length:516 start_codon:yes stop_codon:yes gene_type:complete
LSAKRNDLPSFEYLVTTHPLTKFSLSGSDSLTVTVNDGTVDVSQTVHVTIKAVNDAPVFLSGTDSISLENATLSSVVYNAQAQHIDSDQLTYSLVNSINILVAGESADGDINIALFGDIAPLHTDRLGTFFCLSIMPSCRISQGKRWDQVTQKNICESQVKSGGPRYIASV